MAKHDQALYMRVTSDDLRRLDALTETIALGTRAGLARAAMRIGLEAIERDPTVLLKRPMPTRGGKRAGAGRKPKGKAKG